MSKVALFIKTKTQAGKRDEVKALWEKHLKPDAVANDKQEIYAFCFDAQDENTLYIFEIYADMEALQSAGQNPAFGAYMQDAMPLLDGMPEVGTTTPLWTKGLAI